MKKSRIAVLADQFINWGGGIDYIRLIINGIDTLNRNNGDFKIEFLVFIPQKSKFWLLIKNRVKVSLNLFRKHKLSIYPVINNKFLLKAFESSEKNNILFYHTNKNLYDLLKKHQIDIILPTFNPFPNEFPISWVGYIYDFQHKYFPNFFTKDEIERRDKHFQSIVDQTKTILVNSNSVKNDIFKYLELKNHTRIITLPFCPFYDENLVRFEVDISNYKLPPKYFLISNQFWKHKNHITAIVAFKYFLDNEGLNDFGLVFTGQTHDERFPDYFNEIKEKITELNLNKYIFILGYISKSDQIQILKNAVAVIQPTLFEGGPGGGSVYESVAYGIRSIVSDIPVNLEIIDETVTFFEHSNPHDLSKKMSFVYNQPKFLYTNNKLKQRNNIRLVEMGEQLLKALD